MTGQEGSALRFMDYDVCCGADGLYHIGPASCFSDAACISHLTWVDLLPQRVQHGAVQPNTVAISRRKLSKSFHKVNMQFGGGSRMGQPGICFGLPHLFFEVMGCSNFLQRDEIFTWPIWQEESRLLSLWLGWVSQARPTHLPWWFVQRTEEKELLYVV